jgi:hypothetical protein
MMDQIDIPDLISTHFLSDRDIHYILIYVGIF